MKIKLYVLLILFSPVMAWAQTSVKFQSALNSSSDICNLSPYFQFNGFSYGYGANQPVLNLQISFGDGSPDSALQIKNRLADSSFFSIISHTFLTSGTFVIKGIITTADGKTDTTSCTATVSTDCDTISGSVYYDLNKNCSFDANDTLLHVVGMDIFKDGIFYQRRDFVNYSFVVPRGHQYLVKPSLRPDGIGEVIGNNSIVCPADKQYVINSLPAVNKDFALKKSISFKELTVDADTTGGYTQTCQLPFKINYTIETTTVGYSKKDVAKFHILFGDGKDTTITKQYDPYTRYLCYVFAGFSHTYTFAGNFSFMATVTMLSDGNTDTLIFKNNIVLKDTCGNIAGYVYNDMNNNCVYDAGDKALSNVPVTIKANGTPVHYAYTDQNGKYAYDVSAGRNYSVELPQNLSAYGFSGTCPASGIITIPALPSSGNNFGLNCTGGSDLSTHVNRSRFRPGSQGYFSVNAYNYNCSTVNSVLKFVLPKTLLSIASITPAPTQTNGDTILWNVNGLSNLAAFNASIVVNISSSAQSSDMICVSAGIDTVAGESTIKNNVFSACYPLNNSLDPNFKEVFPAGTGANGNIEPDKNMLYNIHFQNTGNDTAYNVFILDTLSSNLNWGTLRMISSSHNVSTSILDGGVLKFSFNNIYLPDSAKNQLGSNGYVSYTIDQDPNLADGSQVKNTANIYFDYNPAVVTNTTLNTIKRAATGIHEIAQNKLNIYPNPANGQLNIELAKADENNEIQLMDLVGNIVYSQKAFGNKLSISTTGLASGTYILTLKNAPGTLQREKIVIMH